MKEHSRYPQRSKRIGPYGSVALVNNRATLTGLTRGTYRIQAVVDNNVSLGSFGVFMAVGKREAIDQFPLGVTATTALGEILSVTGTHAWGQNFDTYCAVEIDVMEEEKLSFWAPQGTEIIKFTKVDEIPIEDPELEGRRRE